MPAAAADAPPPDDHDPELDALLRAWVQGWAAARGLGVPVAHGDGWRVDVGWPDQVRRFVFPRMGEALRSLGKALDQPWVFLKACVKVDAMRAALPARWTVQPQTWFMIHDALDAPLAPLPPGYTLATQSDPGSAATIARVLAPGGATAADGRLVLVGDAAIFDRIGTDTLHRRRGLGAAVMGALQAHARERGATHGLLAATADGSALYATLGWRVRAPYASAVIEG